MKVGAAVPVCVWLTALRLTATAPPPARAAADPGLAQRVEAALALYGTMPPFAVRASADAAGVVTLRGVMPDRRGRDLEVRIALGVPGVRGVVDDLEVNGSGAVTAAANAAARQAPPPPDYSIVQLQSAVEQALMDAPDLGACALTATVDANRNVTLNGAVPKPAMKALAGKVAARVRGVATVKNDVTVVTATLPIAGPGAAAAVPAAPATPAVTPEASAPPAPPLEENLAEGRILAAFSSSPAYSGLSCTVSGNDITVAGTVTNKGDHKAAIALVRQVAPGMRIHDWILVGNW